MNNAELIAKLRDTLKTIAIIDSEESPMVGQPDNGYDWRRRSEKQERLAREAFNEVNEHIRLATAPSPESAEPEFLAGESADSEFLVWHKSDPDNAVAAVFPGPFRDRFLEHIYTHPPKPDPQRVELTDSGGHLPKGVTPLDDIAHHVVMSWHHLKPFTEDEDCETGESKTYADEFESVSGMLAHALNYAIASGYLAPAKPFPVDSVVEVVMEWRNASRLTASDRAYAEEIEFDLRNALTAKFGTP